MKNSESEIKPDFIAVLLILAITALLQSCGGGDTAKTSNEADTQFAQHLFHAAPVLLNEPENTDTEDNAASALMGGHLHSVLAEFAQLNTRGLTRQFMESIPLVSTTGYQGEMAKALAVPKSTVPTVSVHTPAQIRVAYGMPALPSTAASALTPAQAAQFGAGQTIYIINAYHDPNITAELAAFNSKFGLPACTNKAIATGASLPLPVASSSGCELSVVYSNANGNMTGSAPAYNSGWATEIALDVQWAHATAPYARIILIEAQDASLNSLTGAVKLANAMGPGVVSMSWDATEFNGTQSFSSVFTADKMTYLAATGDYGYSVNWPAVDPNVLAVGGTSLTYSGTGTRTEAGWAGSGGGTSAYTPKPSYQSNAVPGMGNIARRATPDVAFNADPSSGQYVAIMTPGSSTVTWISAGGTSLATPQWAGLIAVANAVRAQAGKPPLGAPHAVLYGQIASVPSNYASGFADITKGANGTCATCSAKVGYDTATGLGTPNFASLLSALVSSTGITSSQ